MAHAYFTAGDLPKIADLPPTVEHYALKLLHTSGPRAVMWISGLFFSPENTKRLNVDALGMISAPMADATTTGTLPHLLMGDLNIPGRRHLSQEWLQIAPIS